MNQDQSPTPLQRASTLTELMSLFDVNRIVEPTSEFYVPRHERELHKLRQRLARAEGPIHAFLCGHRGSGKTTELKRLLAEPEIEDRYETIYLTTTHFGAEPVDLTHDALLVEIGLALAKQSKDLPAMADLRIELERWGVDVVQTYMSDRSAKAEAGAGGNAWLAFFRAQLAARREWKREEREILEPKVQDLVGILNRMATAIQEARSKTILVAVDDLEKGDSPAHKDMHLRLFQDHYNTLVQPRFSLVYTTPVYFRALAERRIPDDQLVSFPALRLYRREARDQVRPSLNPSLDGYRVLHRFVRQRLADERLIPEELTDELLLLGGGLFRETARAIFEAAFSAHLRGGDRIAEQDLDEVFHVLKKTYQPMIRGSAVEVLVAVLESEGGWVPGIEPFLQSRAVVEYENDDIWLDLRYFLKDYVRSLAGPT